MSRIICIFAAFKNIMCKDMKFYILRQHFLQLSSKVSMLLCMMLCVVFMYSPLSAAKKAKCPPLGPKMTVQEYCKKYGDEARKQMHKYGVPASITLAQGILESGYGSSYLAIEAKNHFGIKAYSRGWTGPVVRCDDDAKDEPFCKFKTVEEGYEYHSTFLRDNTRYNSLFKLDIRDYEGWATGLKRAGYATNPKYAQLLIDMIEKNHLDAYDVKNVKSMGNVHQLYVTKKKGGLKYIRCEQDDDLSVIAKEFGVSKRKLRSWNDLTKQSVLKPGDIIYLQKKNKKAEKTYETHIVKAGESMWSISQLYGVRVTSLMKRNKLVSATVYAGQVLKLR